jgi:hypothetical protein
MLVALCIAAVVWLLGCASGTNMVEVAKVDKTTITWLDRRPEGLCQQDGSIVAGCAYWSADYTRCTMILPKSSPDWLVAHEVRHCFGYSHR